MRFSAEIPKVVQIKMGYGGKLSVHVCTVKILASFDHPQKDRNTSLVENISLSWADMFLECTA